MPLSLVPPGKRKGNRYYLVRGEVAGRSIEVSTKTTDATAAQRFKAALETRLLENRVPDPGEVVTFTQASALYIAYRDPRQVDIGRIERLKRVLGEKPLSGIRQATLIDAANRLYTGRAPATKNREALRPAAAIMHYAAEQEYCGWLRVRLFKEPRAKTRAVSQETAKAIVGNIPALPTYKRQRSPAWLARAEARQKKKRLLLLWLFRQAPRISDALKIQGRDIDLKARTVRRHIGKTDEEITEALHDEVWEALANDPPGPGPLFPWRVRSSVYNWLRPYCRALGIAFTPHMARHSVGKWLNEDGASLRLIMDALHHADPKSSIRYQSTDIEVIRAAGRKLGKIT
jgi:integrase